MNSARPPGRAHWAAEPERSHMWALHLIRWIALACGRRVTRLLLHPIAAYFVLTNGRARRASRDYLGRALGRPASLVQVYRHIHHFAATVLDRIYLLQERFDCFEVSVTDGGVIHVPLDRGEGVMAVGAHLGSFEALRADAQARGERVAMLMYEDNARMINATLAAVAPKADLRTIALGQAGAMLSLRHWLDEGGIAGLLADRTLPAQSGRSRTLWLDFLGRPAPFSDGPFRLAAMLRRRAIFVAGLYHGGRRYELRFVELADFRDLPAQAGDEARDEADRRVREALLRYVRLIEATCRESPYNWFNFYDFWAADANPPPSSSLSSSHDGAA
ncbi:MAG: acyl-CoA synthetase [Rhizobacter sp.]|nr:acyl-CoA synthetase [Rhizobacter sp.]